MSREFKELYAIAIIDSRINGLKDEIRGRMINSELTQEEIIRLVNQSCDDISDAVCRLYDVAEG